MGLTSSHMRRNLSSGLHALLRRACGAAELGMTALSLLHVTEVVVCFDLTNRAALCPLCRAHGAAELGMAVPNLSRLSDLRHLRVARCELRAPWADGRLPTGYWPVAY